MMQAKPAVAQEVRGISFQEFLKLYDGQHAEWLPDGTVEVHVSNNVVHQRILQFLSMLLGLYLGFKPLGQLLLAGVMMDVGDDKPAREPDLMIILSEHRDRIKETYLDGPADIAVEIVSPESDERDHGKKLIEYEAAGVPEYWLFDPIRKQADIYVLTQVSENELRYLRAELNKQGHLVSTLLPGFALDPAVLWQEELPTGGALIQMVQEMVGEKA